MLKSNAGGASNGERMGRLLIAYWRFIPAIAVTWLLVKPGVEGRINPAATGFFALIASVAVMMYSGMSGGESSSGNCRSPHRARSGMEMVGNRDSPNW